MLKRLLALVCAMVFGLCPGLHALAEAPETTPAALSASVSILYDYCVANRDEIEAEVNVSGGAAPYRLEVIVSYGQHALSTIETELEAAGAAPISYLPTEAGRYTLSVRVKDSKGWMTDAKSGITVIAKAVEGENEWAASTRVRLTHDWRTDLIAVATTQLGYRESATNTIVDEKGFTKGYTRYGHWLNVPYVDWCAAFISFCFHYAEIPIAQQLKGAGVQGWISNVKALHAYHPVGSGYRPKQGDIVFLVPDQESSHMGIVEYTAGDYIGTIEGNCSDTVDRRAYKADGKLVTGYGSIAEIMLSQGIITMTDTVPISIEVTPLNELAAKTKSKSVNLRAGPDTLSTRLERIETKGSRLTAHARIINKAGETWYMVTYRSKLGFIREDLITLQGGDVPEEAPDEGAEAMKVLEEPVSGKWRYSDSKAALTFRVTGVTACRWQSSDGQRWEYIPDATDPTLTIDVDLDALKRSYRCIVTGEDGTTLTSLEATLLPEDIVLWLRETEGVTDDLLAEKLAEEGLLNP